MSKQNMISRFAGLFRVPNIQGKQYAPGLQPNSPGESAIAWAGPVFHDLPWPNAVPTLNVLANHPGIPRSRAPVPVNDQYAGLPENYLFIGGVIEKSRG